jgi:hypothetical protein
MAQLSLSHVIYSPHGLLALSKLSLLRPSLIRQPTIDLPPAISGRSFTAFEKSARSGYPGAFDLLLCLAFSPVSVSRSITSALGKRSGRNDDVWICWIGRLSV